MFFSGDPSARRRVDLGGRSSKERDRKVLLEQTREERRRRQGLRLQNTSATKIQVCSRLAPLWLGVGVGGQTVRSGQGFS